MSAKCLSLRRELSLGDLGFVSRLCSKLPNMSVFQDCAKRFALALLVFFLAFAHNVRSLLCLIVRQVPAKCLSVRSCP